MLPPCQSLVFVRNPSLSSLRNCLFSAGDQDFFQKIKTKRMKANSLQKVMALKVVKMKRGQRPALLYAIYRKSL
jgi:hypothetical protein